MAAALASVSSDDEEIIMICAAAVAIKEQQQPTRTGFTSVMVHCQGSVVQIFLAPVQFNKITHFVVV